MRRRLGEFITGRQLMLPILNGAERSLRGIAVGRKNWNFYGSDEGGPTAAILTSITATRKRLRIDPFEYLRDLFQRISTYPQSNIDDLLLDKWKAARATSTSQS
jgi:transposase